MTSFLAFCWFNLNWFVHSAVVVTNSLEVLQDEVDEDDDIFGCWFWLVCPSSSFLSLLFSRPF
jgi:hypothetical protein